MRTVPVFGVKPYRASAPFREAKVLALIAPAMRTALLAAAVLLAGCSPRTLLLQQAAQGLAGQGLGEEDDLVLAREAGAFYLKLSESVLRETPGHLPLAETVAGGFTQYAYAFVAQPADELEPLDARAAQRLRQRAARLYWRAHGHAMAALEARQPGFARALAVPPSGSARQALRLESQEVAVAYWAAASWGAYIALSTDKPEVVADLPLAQRLASLAWQREPDHGQGALATLMGNFEAASPTGAKAQALAYFDRAEAAAGGRSAAVYLARAEALALPAGDRAAFETLLRKAVEAAGERRDLSNQVMRARAQWLLTRLDDLF